MTKVLRTGTYLAAGALLVSCSHGSSKDDPAPDAISFGQSIANEDNVSRANDADVLAQLQYNGMRVWGYKVVNGAIQTVMDGYQMTYDSDRQGTTSTNTAGWEYVNINSQSIKYWDDNATEYRFMAVSQSTATASSATQLTVNFTVDASDIKNCGFYSHLNKITLINHNVVEMKFLRPICQIEFYFINDLGEHLYVYTQAEKDAEETDGEHHNVGDVYKKIDGQRVYVAQLADDVRSLLDIELRPATEGAAFASQGTATVVYPITDSESVTFSCVPTTGASLDNPTLTNTVYQLLPYDVGALTLSVKLNYNDTPRLATVPAEYTHWQPNTKYTYVFKITDKDIEFLNVVQVGITAWVTETDQRTHNFYNW